MKNTKNTLAHTHEPSSHAFKRRPIQWLCVVIPQHVACWTVTKFQILLFRLIMQKEILDGKCGVLFCENCDWE